MDFRGTDYMELVRYFGPRFHLEPIPEFFPDDEAESAIVDEFIDWFFRQAVIDDGITWPNGEVDEVREWFRAYRSNVTEMPERPVVDGLAQVEDAMTFAKFFMNNIRNWWV